MADLSGPQALVAEWLRQYATRYVPPQLREDYIQDTWVKILESGAMERDVDNELFVCVRNHSVNWSRARARFKIRREVISDPEGPTFDTPSHLRCDEDVLDAIRRVRDHVNFNHSTGPKKAGTGTRDHTEEILRLRRCGVDVKEIAARFGVKRGAVYRCLSVYGEGARKMTSAA